jgi:hypothetical protein
MQFLMMDLPAIRSDAHRGVHVSTTEDSGFEPHQVRSEVLNVTIRRWVMLAMVAVVVTYLGGITIAHARGGSRGGNATARGGFGISQRGGLSQSGMGMMSQGGQGMGQQNGMGMGQGGCSMGGGRSQGTTQYQSLSTPSGANTSLYTPGYTTTSLSSQPSTPAALQAQQQYYAQQYYAQQYAQMQAQWQTQMQAQIQAAQTQVAQLQAQLQAAQWQLAQLYAAQQTGTQQWNSSLQAGR